MIAEELEFAIEAAKKAGQITLEFFQQAELDITEKADGSPVTQADKKAEEFLRAEIQRAFPEDGIIGEEFGESAGNSGRNWIIDPIDGTKSFISGVPTYSTLLALKNSPGSFEGNPADHQWDLGVIYIPALEEMVYAYNGKGCWRVSQDKPARQVQVSSTKSIKSATVVASGADYVPLELMKQAKIFRTWGDGYGYLLLASGQVDVMLDADLSIWDIAPMYTIIPEAGGEILNWGDDNKKVAAKTAATNKAISSDLKKYL